MDILRSKDKLGRKIQGKVCYLYILYKEVGINIFNEKDLKHVMPCEND